MKFKILNFDEMFDPERDKDIIITNPDPVKNKAFTEDGVYSESVFGNFHTTSEFKHGWIYFGEKCYIVNPILYFYLKKVIPKLKRILETNRSVDLDGNITFTSEIDNIGLTKFKENFDYYIEEYGNKDCPQYEFIMKHRDVLFINKIPIYSSKLRPAILITGKKESNLIHDDINDVYNIIIKYSNDIKDSDLEIEGSLLIDTLMYNLQEKCNTLYKKIVDGSLRKKKGFIRNNMLGSRVNYSARNIISPLVGYDIDAVKMPYRTFMELYKHRLINIISKTKGISLFRAEAFFRKRLTHFDKEMYGYMKELNEKSEGGLWILLNRNPSISIGSFLLLKIVDVKEDYDDMVLEISNNILNSLSGDFDGDVLNIIPLHLSRWVEDFQCLHPSKLLISANDGKFNNSFFLEKEQKLGIFILNN